jgi:hypothetical protein
MYVRRKARNHNLLKPLFRVTVKMFNCALMFRISKIFDNFKEFLIQLGKDLLKHFWTNNVTFVRIAVQCCGSGLWQNS